MDHVTGASGERDTVGFRVEGDLRAFASGAACRTDERTHRLIGREKVIGRLAGQMTSVIYALLKQDHELLAQTEPGNKPPEPMLYDRETHHRHRTGHYRFMRNREERLS